MAFGDVISTVLDLTGRPDKESYIRASVNPLIRMIASLKDHPNTLVEAPQAVSNALLVHTLALPADFRKVCYIRPASRKAFLTPVPANRALTQGTEVVNCYYHSGTNLIIRLQSGYQTTELAFGYYAHPAKLVADTDNNWVLDDYQDIIIDLCTAKILRVTGDVNGATALENGLALRIQQVASSSTNGEILLGG